ncbi:MAG: nuclear transport factor 2 family protein [Solirubrobacterales bacterium]
MSKDNIESARRLLEAIGREDYGAALALVHPEIEFFPPGEQAPHRGAESFRRWMEPDAFAEQVIDPLEVIEASDRRVLGRQHIAARGAGSGIELETTTWSVWTFDGGGLVTRVEIFLPHEEAKAREAADLSGP